MNSKILSVSAVLLGTSFGCVRGQDAENPGAVPGVTPPPAGAPAAPGNNTPPGSMDFYKRNPELMKRYFPHLVQAPGAPGAAAEPAPEAKLYSFEFPGGKAADFVEYLSSVAPNPPNIMISPAMQEAEVPPFKLKNVSFEDLFQALNSMNTQGAGGFWQMSGSSKPIWVLNPGAGGSGGMLPVRMPASPPIYGVSGVQAAAPKEPKRTMIFSVGPYLGDYDIADITTAIETAWEMSGYPTQAQLKFHKDTNLLIAYGTGDQITVIEQVLMALERGRTAGVPNPKIADDHQKGEKKPAQPAPAR